MIYDNSRIRRRDRLMEEKHAREILKNGEFGVISMTDATTGGGYGVPLNYVWNGENAIYIHCAPEGRKLENIAANNNVSFCITGKTHIVSGAFTTEYESIVLSGKATTDISKDERMKALRLIIDKFSPSHREKGYEYCKASFERVRIIRIDIDAWSGKCKHINKPWDEFSRDKDSTLIIIKNGKETRFNLRGIANLYRIVKSGDETLKDSLVIDKAIGKAAAALIVLGKARRACTALISTPALNLFEKAGIDVDYETEVPLILNRTKTDICPMERLCSQSNNPEDILKLIDEFIRQKHNGSNN